MPDVLANKIAAGELVQRPASVAKELIENAVDAGAQHIELIIKKAGSELVQVVDDGCGMGPTDALACFGRHATSKLQRIEDLDRLATLGFRGEALASIGAVAHVELRTRRVADPTGTCVRVDGGHCVDKAPCAAPPGTSVAVRNIFYNVPARRNFLKTPATEFKHLVETFQTQALANPALGFCLVHDDTEVYRLSAAPVGLSHEEALVRRIADLFKGKSGDNLVPVAETTSYLSVQGFVGRPEDAKRSRSEQFLFVNGRYVQSRSLDHAVAGAFGALVPEGRHPFFVIALTVDPRHVDVNVHPAKTEVKFDDERGVYGFLRAVVKRGLAQADLALTFDAGTAQATVTVQATGQPVSLPSAGAAAPGAVHDQVEDSRSEEGESGVVQEAGPVAPLAFLPPPFGSTGDGSAGPPLAEEHATIWPKATETGESGAFSTVTQQSSRGTPIPSRLLPEVEDSDEGEAWEMRNGARTIWPLHGRYILTPIATGLMLLDQRAAHERILYERALTAMEGGMAASQQLLFPHTIDVTPADYALLEELLPELRSLGFELEMLSGRGVLVRGVPSDVRLGSERSILEDMLAQYRANSESFQLQGRENLARSLARRSALKPGRMLSPTEAHILIDQLFACRMPFADPSGRPTMMKISLDELERRFSHGGR